MLVRSVRGRYWGWLNLPTDISSHVVVVWQMAAVCFGFAFFFVCFFSSKPQTNSMLCYYLWSKSMVWFRYSKFTHNIILNSTLPYKASIVALSVAFLSVNFSISKFPSQETISFRLRQNDMVSWLIKLTIVTHISVFSHIHFKERLLDILKRGLMNS